MTAAIITIGLVALALSGALILLARALIGVSPKLVAMAEAHATTTTKLGAKTTECERLAFEKKTTTEALDRATAKLETMAKGITDAATDLGAGLDAGDVRGRLLRIAKAEYTGAAAGDLPAEPAAEVHVVEAASGPDPARVPDRKPIDVLR